MKNERITIRISDKIKKEYFELCKGNDSVTSLRILKLIKKDLKKLKKRQKVAKLAKLKA